MALRNKTYFSIKQTGFWLYVPIMSYFNQTFFNFYFRNIMYWQYLFYYYIMQWIWLCLLIVVSNTYCVFVLFCFCFFFLLCTLCYQFLWIFHFWLPLHYSLVFISYYCHLFQSTNFRKTFWNVSILWFNMYKCLIVILCIVGIT